MPARGDVCRAANRTLSATSWRKAVLSAAASSKVSGGTRRVLARPGADAFAIKAMPQDAAAMDLPLYRSGRFTRCPLECASQCRNAKISRKAPITSGSRLTSRQTPKSYSLHQVVIVVSRSAPGECHADTVAVGDRGFDAVLPCRRGSVVGPRHIERDELPSLNADEFDRHRDRPRIP